MTVFKTSLNKVLKSTALVLIASTLMACQGETSANNETPAVTNVVEEKVVAQYCRFEW